MEFLANGLLVSTISLTAIVFLFFFYAFVYSWKVYFYLQKEKYDRWCELTTIGNFGPGGSNPFKWFPYLYSELDNEDKVIFRYKERIRFGLRYGLYSLAALIVNVIVWIVLIVRCSK